MSVWLALVVAVGPGGPIASAALAGAGGVGVAATGGPALVGAVGVSAGPGAEESGPAWSERGALVGLRPLGAGVNGMRVGGGFALALPFVGFEYGRGVGGDVDLAVHYEAVVGLLHFVDLTVRWAPVAVGDWRLGLRLGVAYSFFGLASDNTSLTSTLFLTPELGASVLVGGRSELILGFGVELDLLEWVVLEGDEQSETDVRVDAVLARFGWRTRFAESLDVYVVGRLRVPTETFDVDDEQFALVPYAELGGAWAF